MPDALKLISPFPLDSQRHLGLLTPPSLKQAFLLVSKTLCPPAFLSPISTPPPLISSPPPLPNQKLFKKFRTMSVGHPEIDHPSLSYSSGCHTSPSNYFPGLSRWNCRSVPTDMLLSQSSSAQETLALLPRCSGQRAAPPAPALFHILDLVYSQVLLVPPPQSACNLSLLSMLLSPASSRAPASLARTTAVTY